MLSVLLSLMLAASVGPIAPDKPAHEPQLAANDSLVVMTFGAGNGIYFSASRDFGKTFSNPMKVAEADIVPLTRHRGPRIVLSGETIVISAVTGRTPSREQHAHGLPSDGDLLVWRSLDRGKSWSKGIVVNDVPGAPTEGLHTLAADTKGRLFAAWLDKRGGNGTKLYGASSIDGGLTWSKNALLYQSPEGTICECCHPSAAFDSGDRILVMWRNWLAGARDMYLTRSQDGVSFSKPEKLGTGSWQLNGCPMDGGGMVTTRGRVVTAWRRDENVYLSEPGKQETQIGTGKDIALATSRDRIYAIWSSGGKIELWSAGQTRILSESGSFPSLTGVPDGVIAAWEENGAIMTRHAGSTTDGQ